MKRRSIRLQTLNRILIALAVLAGLVFLYSSSRLESGLRSLEESTTLYLRTRTDAFDLQQGSDELTRNVREYVVTGDATKMGDFFTEVNVTRRRENALNSLRPFLEGGSAYEELQQAMEHSLQLMEVEYEAMALRASADNLKYLPEEIATVQLSEAEKALSSEEKIDKAIDLVFNEEYRFVKQEIYHHINACVEEVYQQTEAQQTASSAVLRRAVTSQQATVFLLLAFTILMMVLNSQLVIQPILHAVDLIRKGETIPMKGSDEMQFLANAYNENFEANKRRHEELEEEASHDALTGLYNRAAYEKIADDDHGKFCFLLIDVDHFKDVNDSYGHDVGDLALKKAAEVIKHKFRNEDYVFRLGGDEFAVIMVAADESLKEVIRGKLRRANEELKDCEGLPPLSLSTGAAFGEGKVSEELFKNADNVLYDTKKNGRGGIRFHL